MKAFKKLSAALLTLCLCVSCFSFVAHAADGRISFTDPSTAVGDEVEVKCVVRSTSSSLGNMEVKLSYDTASLKFESGDGVKENGGALTYTGTGGSTETSFTMKFQALKEGSTKVEVSGATIASDVGTTLTLDQGNSTVKIAAGDPSKIKSDSKSSKAGNAADKTVKVNGKSYTLTDEFSDNDVPSGYSRVTVSLDGEDRQMVKNEDSGITLGYLMDSDKKGDFFMYNEEDATFSPYEEVSISDSTSIVVLSDTSKVKLPSNYQEAKLTLNDKEFPVWQNSDSTDYYVLYAMNDKGETGYYQYDSQENTYQRMDDPSETSKTDTSSKTTSNKLPAFVNDHLQMIVLAGGIGAVVLLLILIILGIKLHNRNAELDELYDEYGIDVEEEPVPVKNKKEKKNKKESRFGKKKQSDEDDFETYDGEDFDNVDDGDAFEEAYVEDDYDAYDAEDAYEDAYDEDDFEDEYDAYDEDEFGEITYEEDDYGNLDKNVFAGYTPREELTIDDLDDLLGETPKKKRGHMEDDDTFKVDFIDLD